jgi:predicted phosphodiesterase
MKTRRFVIAGDTHGDMLDVECAAQFFAFLKDWKPEVRIHSGDLFDFRNLRKGASDDEKAASLIDDWDAGSDFARRFFEGGKENHLLRGNHDERLWDFTRSATGLLRDYAADGVKRAEGLMRKCGAKMLPYDSRLGVLDVGHLRVIHGYKSGIGAAAAHARTYRNCFYGHTHDMSVAPVENLDGPAEARGIGCLCKIDMDYNSRQTNKLRHQQGWVYGLLLADGTYQAFQAKRIHGKFACAHEIKTY